MNETALNYVQNQLAQGAHRLKGHTTDSFGKPYPQRYLFKKLEKYLNDYISGNKDQRWIVIPGLRGVGKTTVLAQLFLSLIGRIESTRILYISMDELTGLLSSSLTEVLSAYESIIGKSYERLDEPLFIFIDEIQYDANWGLALKSLYDKTKNVFICCTGSSAVSLQTNPDIYRRVVLTKLFPMSFTEYQMIQHKIYPVKGLKEDLRQAIYFSENSNEIYKNLLELNQRVLQYWSQIDKLQIQHYLISGSLPFALKYTTNTQVFESINGLLDKIIHKDIEELNSFDSHSIYCIKRLLFILADATDVLSIKTIRESIEIDTNVTIQRIFDVLCQAELLVRITPYGSQKSKLTKPSKYLFMSSVIRMALLGIVGKKSTFNQRMGKLFEDVMALHFNREFISRGIGSISYDSAQKGADFILHIDNQKEIVIEVGIGKKDKSQVQNTMKKINCTNGIVISEGGLKNFPEENIVCIPIKYFLLM